MANIQSAKTRIRRNERRAAINKSRMSRVRTFLRKVEEAIEAGDQKQAADAYKAVQPELMRASSKGLFHKNTVARKLSRLTTRIKALKA